MTPIHCLREIPGKSADTATHSKVKDVVARAVALHAIRYSFNTGDVFVPKVQASQPQMERNGRAQMGLEMIGE